MQLINLHVFIIAEPATKKAVGHSRLRQLDVPVSLTRTNSGIHKYEIATTNQNTDSVQPIPDLIKFVIDGMPLMKLAQRLTEFMR